MTGLEAMYMAVTSQWIDKNEHSRAVENVLSSELPNRDLDGKLKIGSVAPGLKESGCKFCTACVEVCPTGAIRDKVRFTGDRESVLLPCVNACPAGIDIPGYPRFVSQGKCYEALAVIRENVPFPGILCRVCIHPCEDACRRGEINEPVSICALKRYAADHAESDPIETLSVLPDTGKQVAVVGAGPGGLSAAYYIRKKGHAVTIYDSMDKAGGMMRYGIPRHRLPEKLLDREIGAILDLGINFRSEESIGNGISLKDLRSGYDAIFLSTGAQLSRKLDIDGSDSPAVMWGIDFLREVSTGIGPGLKGTVVVIGGGNVAIDVASTSRRLGAKRVHLVCLEKREEMPAHDWEIAQAEDKGIIIHNSWGPKSISTSRNGISGIECKACTDVFDKGGYFNPRYNEGKRTTFEADYVIMAIGQTADLKYIETQEDIKIVRGLIEVNPETFETGVSGIFAGGDAVAFPGAIIESVRAARTADSSIDRFLEGDGDIIDCFVRKPSPSPRLGRDENFACQTRGKTREIKLGERTGFDEVDLGFSAPAAVAEALNAACNAIFA